MLDQPEIGILGFALRPGSSGCLEILCYAKPEPGNTQVIQVAPSFQATQSNFERLHGGQPQVLRHWFQEPGAGHLVSSSLQTETSEFFFRKRNRNVIRLLTASDSAEPMTLPPYLRWFSLERTLKHIDAPFLFNTDARSVLVSADWHQLAAGGRPFQTRGPDPEVEALLSESFSAMDSPSQLKWSAVEEWIRDLKSRVRPPVTRVPLQDACDWIFDDKRIIQRTGERYSIRQISVEMPGRERPQWDQPILGGSAEGLVILVCSVIGGVLHFLVAARSTCGSFHGFDINALQVSPCQYPPPAARDRQILERVQDLKHAGRTRVLAASRFSDEGGRFFRTVSRYEVHLVPGDSLETSPGESEVWLTLGQLKALVNAGELVSSEARSALSLLLRYL